MLFHFYLLTIIHRTVPGTEYVLYTRQLSPIQQADVATEPQDSFRERVVLFVFNLLFLLTRVEGHSCPSKDVCRIKKCLL